MRWPGGVLTAAGTTTAVSGPVIRTAHGAFVVTPECIVTPLIPLYLAGALSVPFTVWPRVLVLVAAPVVFFTLGVARLLVLAVPEAVVGSHAVAIHAFFQMLVAGMVVGGVAVWTAGWGSRATPRTLASIMAGIASGFTVAPILDTTLGAAMSSLQALGGHAGHTFADSQGAMSMLPAFQIGLFVALWVAAGRLAWRSALLGLVGLALAQPVFGLAVGELASHYGFSPHVGLIRAWAIVLPLALVWVLARPPYLPYTWRSQPLPVDGLSPGGPTASA